LPIAALSRSTKVVATQRAVIRRIRIDVAFTFHVNALIVTVRVTSPPESQKMAEVCEYVRRPSNEIGHSALQLLADDLLRLEALDLKSTGRQPSASAAAENRRHSFFFVQTRPQRREPRFELALLPFGIRKVSFAVLSPLVMSFLSNDELPPAWSRSRRGAGGGPKCS